MGNEMRHGMAQMLWRKVNFPYFVLFVLATSSGSSFPKAELIQAYSTSAALQQVDTFSKLLAAALIYNGDAATAESATKQVNELLKDVSDPMSEHDFITVIK